MSQKRLCERCGTRIPAERIEALPDTHVCVGCAREIGGSEFKCEHGYGCVTEIAKVRKPIVPKKRNQPRTGERSAEAAALRRG